MSHPQLPVNLSHIHNTRSFMLFNFATLSAFLSMLVIKWYLPIFIPTQFELITLLVIGLFVIYLNIFNFVVWRWTLLHRMKLIEYPDFNGIWTGYLTSEWTDHSQLYPISLHIKQTWLSTQINFLSEDSESRSHTASILRSPDGTYQMHYIYYARPSRDDHPSWRPFVGLCMLTYRDGNTLSGYYEYFDREHQKAIHGQMYVEKGKQPIKSLKGDPHRQE